MNFENLEMSAIQAHAPVGDLIYENDENHLYSAQHLKGFQKQDFFRKSDSITFVNLRCPNFQQEFRKTNEQPLRYF